VTTGVQCETCRVFSPQPSGQWLYLVRPVTEPSVLAALGVIGGDPGTFCSPRCLAEWAYVQAVTGSPATGIEPPSSSGVGWPA
jgi:hypothetical protein